MTRGPSNGECLSWKPLINNAPFQFSSRGEGGITPPSCERLTPIQALVILSRWWYWTASATWAARIASLPLRSAIVRATRRLRLP